MNDKTWNGFIRKDGEITKDYPPEGKWLEITCSSGVYYESDRKLCPVKVSETGGGLSGSFIDCYGGYHKIKYDAKRNKTIFLRVLTDEYASYLEEYETALIHDMYESRKRFEKEWRDRRPCPFPYALKPNPATEEADGR